MDMSGVARLKRCEALSHPEAHWARRILSNGGQQNVYWCPTCVRPVTGDVYGTTGQAVTAQWLQERLGIDAKQLPEVRIDLYYKLCPKCLRTRLCEMHHVAMRAAFPDADEWPVIPLCPECHDKWTKGYQAYVERRIQQALKQLRQPDQAA